MRVRRGERKAGTGLASIELNGLPLYASANSTASSILRNFIKTRDRLGAESLYAHIVVSVHCGSYDPDL